MDASNLALFIMAASLATVVSSPFWGRVCDASSRRVAMARGAWTAITVGGTLIAWRLPEADG